MNLHEFEEDGILKLTWRNKRDDTDDRIANSEDRPENSNRFAVANIIRCIHV